MNLRQKIALLRADSYQLWIASNEPDEKMLDNYRHKALPFEYRPKISLITSVWNTDNKWLKLAIESVLNQVYDNWELCLTVSGATQPQVREVLEQYAQKDSRIKVKLLGQNLGAAAASNEALTLATGEFIGLLGHEDELAYFALYECIKLLNQEPQADMIYSDEDRITDRGKRSVPSFKPDWSPDMLLSCQYIGHLGIYRKKVMDEIGGFRADYEGTQDYDMVLRFVEKTNEIYHIPKVLYHRRIDPESTASGSKDELSADLTAKKAIGNYLTRNNIGGKVVDGYWPGSYRVRHQIVGDPLVSIIIPSKDNTGVLRTCIDSIIHRTDYDNFDILIVDNGSNDSKTLDYYREIGSNPKVKILHYDRPFNFSALNNYAASQAKGEHLLFLNDDTEVISPEWLSAMIEHSQRKEVGAVGAKLLFPDGTIQHCGVILGLSPFKGYGVAGHAYSGHPDHPGYMGRVNIISNYSAVTAACIMLKKQVFEEIGGFDENLAFAYNDVDLCLKIRRKGYLIVYTPYAQLYHHESRTRGYEDTPEKQERFLKEIEYIRARWGYLIDEGDPYYNQNLTLGRPDFSLRVPDDRAYSKLRGLIYKTIAYYRRHGPGRTIRRAFTELRTRLTSRRKVEIYPPQSSLSSISKASTLKKVSFLVGLPRGESRRYRVYNIVEGLQSRGVASCVFYETNLDKLERIMDSNLVVIFRALTSPKVEASPSFLMLMTLFLILNTSAILMPSSICPKY
jgi:glycosyltransferase involved in cell wall biosynthesis